MIQLRTLAPLLLAATLAACGAETGQSEFQPVDTVSATETPGDVEPVADVLTPYGWGPLRIGMSRADVVAAAGEDANPDAVGGPEPSECDEFRPRDAPAGMLVMIEQGVLTRISVSGNADIETPESFRIGDAGSTILSAYESRATVDPHKYWPPPARYITVWRSPPSEAERRGIRYEIDPDGVVVHLRAGGPSIEYVEGCA